MHAGGNRHVPQASKRSARGKATSALATCLQHTGDRRHVGGNRQILQADKRTAWRVAVSTFTSCLQGRVTQESVCMQAEAGTCCKQASALLRDMPSE